ncbi:hypothetical protein D9V75_01745 [Buchnera aphidicola (Muscaphis stroyani)]|uniref:Uncharacterized protein n=1 Tax=Buchnera aphidicola (Muscaphis stroyani) TaxID=1241869 RepID=A0A4D6YFX6_9GAMM|nr:hypothetical protein D9V75_01745 [Buchnera aphidicola (Muscaphis stroyani)]
MKHNKYCKYCNIFLKN